MNIDNDKPKIVLGNDLSDDPRTDLNIKTSENQLESEQMTKNTSNGIMVRLINYF